MGKYFINELRSGKALVDAFIVKWNDVYTNNHVTFIVKFDIFKDLQCVAKVMDKFYKIDQSF